MTLDLTTSAPVNVNSYRSLLSSIRRSIRQGKARAQDAVEREKVRTSWEIGKLILDHVLANKKRGEYGESVIRRLSKDLSISARELRYMVEFARTYKNLPTSADLNWSQYRDLLAVNDAEKRRSLAQRSSENNWTIKELRREIKKQKASTPLIFSKDALSSSNDSLSLVELTPGTLDTYQIVRINGELKIDLGFGIYLDLPSKYEKKFKEGYIVRASEGTKSQVPDTKRIILVHGTWQPGTLFTYRARVFKVYDGDTFHAFIDVGFGVALAQRLRLRRLDAPELHTKEGERAKRVLEKALNFRPSSLAPCPITIKTSKSDDQYGRYMVDTWVKGTNIDQELLDSGLYTVRPDA